MTTEPATSSPDEPVTVRPPSALDAEPEPTREPPAAEEQTGPDEAGTRSARRQRGDGEKYRGQLRLVEAERDRLRQQVRDLQRAEVARTTGVPEGDIVGDDLDAMTESAATFAARVEAELKRRGFGPAAPSSMVSDGAERPVVNTGSDFVRAFTPPHRR